jgi:hypothetical protein
MNDKSRITRTWRTLILTFAVCLSAVLVTGCGNFFLSDLLDDPSAGGGGPLSISPISATLLVDTSCVFTADGGDPPYVFSVQSGGGSIDADSGIYKAPLTPGSAIIQVRDDNGDTSEAEAIYIE